jgi:hypothetical protein
MATTHVVPNGEWLLLCKIEDDHAKNWVLDELRAKRLRYRYFLDEKKVFRYDDLPERFWHMARIDWIWSVATVESSSVQGIEIWLAGIGPKPDPAATADTTRGRGRPRISAPVKAEAERRLRDGEVTPQHRGLARFVRELADWHESKRKEQDPPLKELKHGTIENHIRPIWNSYLGPR